MSGAGGAFASPREVLLERPCWLDGGCERARRGYLYRQLCCVDERDRVQKKTFTKWVNKHLIKAQRHISDLYEDLRDGHNLISLLEVLSGDSLPREKGRMRFHKLQNVQIALDYLRHRQVKLVNIRNDDIADGNPKLTLGLIWTIILHFQISDIQVSGQSEDMTAKEKLLLWSQRMVEGYQGLRCDNFTSSWRDGRLFNAIIHRHKPMLIDMNKVYRQTNLENLDQAFSVAERDLGVTRLLDPEDVDVPQPDEKSIITYVSSLYDAMPRVPDVQDGVRANELQLRWQEYRELVLLLLQWMRHHTAAFEERRFPSSFEEIEILWSQFLKFKEMELPAKEADKNRSKGIYQSLEGAVQAGQLKVPPGYHPLDVEKEWGKLHVAILEREKQLRSEFERLECLQRIVTKLQMEAGLCEEQLNQADALLQSVRGCGARSGLERGRRSLVYRLHERLVAIRTEYNLRLKAGVTAPATQVTQVTLQSVQRRPELEDSTLRYLQDLLAWVEENQHRVDDAEWGVDLPSVEAQLGSHRGLHQSIEEFRAKIERARSDEGQLSPATRGAYRDCLGRLDLQYAKLLNSSKARLRSLESLHSFVAAATKELMWLNEKEEEEVGFDWSDRNTNMTAKKESYSALMRELELKEKKIKELQNAGDRLLREDHPARPTVEVGAPLLGLPWDSCGLELWSQVARRDPLPLPQFFSDVREAEGQLQKLQEALRRKYSCDRSATVTRLEDLLQDAQDEKEQLNEYKGHLSGLAKRAKAIVQLKPRHPAHPMRGRLPLLAVCDYKQVEVTVHKGDECQLVGPAQPSHWKVLSSSGSEAAVPSVCFLVPPPNQEAQEAVTRLEAQHQALVTLWHQLHVDMKSLLAWQSLRRDVQLIRSWSLATFRTLKPEEQRQALHSLELHYQAFLRDSQDAGGFGPEDRLMAEREYGSCSHHYQQLLQSLEQGAQEESRCQRCISELKDIRLQLEACETRTVHRLRLPLDKEPARECAQRITEQQKAQAEVEGLGKGVARLSAEAEKVLALPEPSPAAPTLRSELELTLGKLEQVRSLSAIYLEKLKTISLVIRSTQGAEEVLRAHEEQLKEAQAVPATLPELEATKASLKKLRAQAEAQQPMFDALRDELRGAQEVGERLQQRHGERDVEVERWRERVAQLLERWQAVLAQTDVRQRELEQLGRQLRYYRESADPLGAWLQDARQRQEQIQAMPLADSQAVREQLRQEKALLEEIERHGEKVEECQRFAKQYINAIKDYELQLVTYKAQLEPVASPAKKPKVQSGSESVIQEYVDLRTRYSELTTLTSQYIKFISETLRRMEEEERLAEQQRAEERERLAEVEAALEKQRQLAEAHAQAKAQAEREAKELQQRMQEEVVRREEAAVDAQQQKRSIQEELQQLRQSSEAEIQAKARQAEAAERSRLRIEEEIRVVRLQLEATERQRGGAEGELQALRARAEEAEAQKRQAQEEAERLRRQVQDESQRKRQAEAELALRVKAEAEAAREKQRALQALEELRLQAEEAERRLRQAEVERARQVQVALETAQRSAEAELQSKRASFAEKTAQLERSLQEEHVAVAQLREEAERRAQQQAEAERAREEAERELERWQLKANEALRLRLQAEEVAQQKSLAQAEAEKQKEEAEREARRRGKAEEQNSTTLELEAEAGRFRELAKRQRQLAEEDAARQRAEAERVLAEKLAAISEATRLKTEAEIALKEKEAENERLRRLAEDEAFQRRRLEEQAAQHKADIEERLAQLRKASDSELERQKGLVEDTLRQRRQVEEEILALKASFEKAAAGKAELELELGRIRSNAEDTLRSKEQAELEAARQRQLAAEEEQRRREAEERVQKSLAAEEEAARQRKAALEEVERLKAKVEEARRLRERAEQESARQLQLAQEAAQKRLQAEEKAHAFAVQQKEQELQQTLQQEQSVLDRLRSEAEAARRAAEEAEEARVQAEREAAQSRRQVEEAERLKQLAEEQAQARAQAQAAAEKLRKDAEQEAARRAQAEQAALRQKQAADAEMEKHKKFAEQTLRQKAQVEQELTTLRLQLEETDHQKNLLDEELHRLKAEATEAARQRSQVEEELFSVRVQMEELSKLKARIEAENRALILRDKDNTQRFLQEEAEKMKQVAEEAARLSVAAQEAARLRQLAEEDLAQQRALAEKMLKEKMQAVQEATRLKAEAELLQQQKELAQEQARRLQEDKEQMAQQLAEETQGFQRTLEAERQRQLEMSAEAERLKLRMAEMSRAQARAEEDAQRFRKQAEEIGEKLHRTELATQEKVTLVQTLEIQRQQSDHDAERLREAIAELEREKEKLQQEAKLLQLKSEEMQTVQQEQLLQETQALQQSFLSEKDSLLQRERFIEQEKAKLEQLFQDEVAKAQQLREEQHRQQQQMEQERQRLVASMEEARRRQHEAEEGVRRKQEELQQLEQQRRQQEELLAEENQRLREQLQRLEEQHRAALAHSEEVTALQVAATKTLPNGRDALDGPATEAEPEHSFDGLRQKVPAQRLQEAGILSTEELQRLAQGHTTVDELARREDVRHYLQGRSSIAGLLLKPTSEKLSVYAALQRQLLSPGTALILLEAQAASGFLLDPVRNRRLTVNEAVKEGVVGPELHHKLLSAERAVTGYKDPYTGQQISLFQAMQKGLIVREHGIRLLEAQIATGGIIDPVHSHRVPVDVAYRRGYFDEEMNRVLADPSDDTKGFFDPNTHENLTYLQLLERCVEDPETGLRLLPLTDKAAKGGELVYTDSEARDVFEKATVSAPFGKFRGKTVTIWEIINSEYFTAEQRRDLLRQFRTGRITVEKIIKIVITVVEEQEQKSRLCFEGLRSLVPAAELLESRVIDHELYHQLQRGERSVREVAEVDTVRRALRGANVIAGVWLEEAGQKLSIYDALKKDLLPSDMAVALLEAQAGTGHIIDPATSARLTVDEAVRAGLVGPEFHEKLLSAEKAVTGYRDPYTGQSVSLFQALKKGLIPREQGLRLLDAQLSTGGVVDPSKSHRVPLDVAYARGCLDEETSRALLAPRADAKAYCDPSTGEPVTYSELQQRCRPDQLTGLSLLPLSEKAARARQEELYSELQARETFEKTPVEVPVGGFKGRTVTVWELISSEYFTAEQRQELLRQFRTGKVTVEKVIKILITIVEEVETLRQERLSFSGLRAPVPASELLASGVLSRDLSELGSVRTLLQGSGCLAGIYLEDSKEKVSIYEAMRRGLLRPSTAALLLEAQAATGFLVDPVRNQRLYVHEAVKAGVVGPELHEQMLSAEKAVTGYRDPYSGSTISLFQAMQKGLVLRQSIREALEAESAWHYLYGTGSVAGVYLPGSRQTLSIYQALKKGLLSAEVARLLLEAQAATGFLLDPVKGERLTVDEAVRKGLVGPELHDRLLSAERAVTGYRDPYTEQTISLFQAMKKELIPTEEALRLLDAQLATGGIVDPHLGFHLPLEVAYQRGYLNKDTHDQLSEPSEVRSYVDPSTDERLSYTQLLRRCRRDDGTGQLLLPLSDARKLTFRGLRKQITLEELVRSQVMDEATALQLREGLTSIEEVTKNLQKFLEGTSCIAGVFVDATKERLSVYQAMKKGIIRPGTAFELLEAQAATGYVIDPIKGLKLTVEEAVRMGIVGPEFKDKLLSAERAVTGYKDPYSGKLISLFQAMKKGLILKDHGIRLLEAQIATGGIIDPEESHRLPVEVAYKRGLFDEEMNEILTDPSDDTKGFFDPNTEENLTYLQLMERCITDPQTGLCLLPLKEKKRERKTSSKSSVRKRRVVIVDPETGKEMSVYEAYRKGLIDHQTYLELSEQECEWEEITISSSDGVVKSMIIDRRSGRQYDIDDAIAKNLIDRSALDQYRAGTLSITEFADMLSGNASGFRSRSSSVGSSSSYPISPAVSRTQLASWSDPTEETGPVAGILDTETLEKVSITEAMHRNLVDNITGQRLLEAQACTGGIIDPSTGERFPVTDAVNKGLVDKIMVDRINLAQKAFCGFEDPRTKTKMSAAQALKKGWLYYEAGQRFLEVQYLTGGLIEPDTPGRVPLDEALQRGTVDARTAQKLRDVGAYSKYLTCPKTKLKISYKDALDRSMVEEGTGLRLLEAATQSTKGYYSPYSVSGSGSTAGSRTGSRTGSRAGSRRGSFDATGSGFSMTFSSSSYSSSGYGRRYVSGSSASMGGPESAVA
uniref:Plectin n=1 Tax=Nomascus leucogenys TaxID=61853 RepID=A0A2I3GDZ1_NOMLE